MAAPSTTVWGSAVTESTSAAKIGIYVALAGTGATSSTVTATIQVWLASKWSLIDSNYTFYFNNESTSATTVISDSLLPKINVTVATGSGWSDSNQVMLYEYSATYSRSSSDKTVNCAAKLKDIDRFSGKTMTVSTSYTIPALTAYTVSFNANGGTGAPSAMTKYRGVNLLLPTTVPTRSGYTFAGWATTSTATTATHQPGRYFGIDENTTLYAVWSTSTFTVTYNANGDSVSNMPLNQTKNAGSTLTLSSTKPTRTDYTFVGWGTSATATTASYQPGGSYTANASITLYAIWKSNFNEPRIENLKIYRCLSSDTSTPPTADDSGTNCYVYFDWATDFTPTIIQILYKKTTDSESSWQLYTVYASSSEFPSSELTNKRGTVALKLGSSYIGEEGFDPNENYDVRIRVLDEKTVTDITRFLPGVYYTIDFLSGGKGIAIGKQAENEGLDIAMDTKIDGSLTVNNIAITSANPTTTTTDTLNTWIAKGTSNHYISQLNCVNGQPNQWAFLLNFVYGANVHQIWLTQANGIMAHRGGNSTNGLSTTWRTILDSSNYSSYALPLTGGTVSGKTTFGAHVVMNNTVNSIGMIRQHQDFFSFFPSVADSGNGTSNTNRKGYIGFAGGTNNLYFYNSVSAGSNISNKTWTISSDKRLKKDIVDIADVYVKIWTELLPKIFRWNEVASNDTNYHFGLIAQDVIAAFEKYGLDYKDYGFVNSFTLPEDDTEYYGIAYDEYHMLTSLVVRKQQEKIDSLEERIEKLEKLILGQEE